MAAAILDFLFAGVEGFGRPSSSRGTGHTFCNCFLAVASKPSKMANPLSFQMTSKDQNESLAFSRTPGLGSARPFRTHFSSKSTAPVESIEFFDRIPWQSRKLFTCPAANARAWTVFSCTHPHKRGIICRGWQDVCIRIASTTS